MDMLNACIYIFLCKNYMFSKKWFNGETDLCSKMSTDNYNIFCILLVGVVETILNFLFLGIIFIQNYVNVNYRFFHTPLILFKEKNIHSCIFIL